MRFEVLTTSLTQIPLLLMMSWRYRKIPSPSSSRQKKIVKRCCILICRCMQKHIQHNKDERTQFFRKIYLSLYWKGCEWEVSWRPNKDCDILTPKRFWLSQPFSPVLLGCSTGGLGALPLLEHGSHSSIFSPTDLNFLGYIIIWHPPTSCECHICTQFNPSTVETIQTTALLRTARILRRIMETWGDLLSLKLQWKTIS